jgi:hypothetical protein
MNKKYYADVFDFYGLFRRFRKFAKSDYWFHPVCVSVWNNSALAVQSSKNLIFEYF